MERQTVSGLFFSAYEIEEGAICKDRDDLRILFFNNNFCYCFFSEKNLPTQGRWIQRNFLQKLGLQETDGGGVKGT